MWQRGKDAKQKRADRQIALHSEKNQDSKKMPIWPQRPRVVTGETNKGKSLTLVFSRPMLFTTPNKVCFLNCDQDCNNFEDDWTHDYHRILSCIAIVPKSYNEHSCSYSLPFFCYAAHKYFTFILFYRRKDFTNNISQANIKQKVKQY